MNDRICNVIGVVGCLTVFFSMGYTFFGGNGVIGIVVGILTTIGAIVNYDT